jgi:XRE family aerobic/anaerobic benzoate catabolism transcriptional regulator
MCSTCLPARRPAELPALAELIESHAARHVAADRGRRIALVGLRGAGKSTLGTASCRELACPFIELDRLVEQDYGARIPDLIEMAGLATFRRYERACLERVIDDHDAAVIATAGGIVSNADTYALLLRRTHTVWIKARPDEHMRRVMEQGDFRPDGAEPRGHGRPRRHPGRASAPTMRARRPSSIRRATRSSAASRNCRTW